MAKFKKGDRVVFCKATPSSYERLVADGATETVYEDSSTVPFIEWDNIDMVSERYKHCGRIIAEDEDLMELIKTENKEQNGKI